MDDATEVNIQVPAPMTFAKFLETVPPGMRVTVDQVREQFPFDPHIKFTLIVAPDLSLHCPSDRCDEGMRVYRFENGDRQIGLGERVGQLLKDEAELAGAISRLTKSKASP